MQPKIEKLLCPIFWTPDPAQLGWKGLSCPLKHQYCGSRGHFGPQMGRTESAVAARSKFPQNLGKRWPSKTRKTQKIVFLARFGPIMDPKATKSLGTPPVGGTKTPERKKTSLCFGENCCRQNRNQKRKTVDFLDLPTRDGLLGAFLAPTVPIGSAAVPNRRMAVSWAGRPETRFPRHFPPLQPPEWPNRTRRTPYQAVLGPEGRHDRPTGQPQGGPKP